MSMPMTENEILEAITDRLCQQHNCHTVILYGSRARGDATSISDFDVMGVRKEGLAFREARLWNGVYLDLFIYSESALEDPNPGMLDMRFGRVLRESGTIARDFFARLEAMHAKGPKLWALDEIEAHKTWYSKALDRIRIGGLQAHVRRYELLPTLLQDYFEIRGEWYLGPKTSFGWLKENRPDLYERFEDAYEPTASVATLESLVAAVRRELM